MPVGFSSPARNLFLLGSQGGQVVTNFFKTINQFGVLDFIRPEEIRFNSSDEKFILAGSANDDAGTKQFGWLEKRSQAGTAEWDVRVEATSSGVNTTLRAMELDSNDNLIVVGKTADIPWIAKYSNGGVIDWQSTTNSADVEYTGVTSDSNGQYYACGNTPDSGEAQAFVEKFDASGNPGWGKSAFMLGRDVVLNKIAANSRGEVVAVGYLEDDSKFKGYIVKIDTNTGEVLWDRTLETDKILSGPVIRPCLCEDVYIDSKDQIYVVGRLVGIGYEIGFIAKYTAEGNMIWQRETPDDGKSFSFYQVKSDGETEQTIVLGRYNGDDTTGYTGVLSKYSKNGSLVWRRKFTSSFGSIQNPVNLDADSAFYYLLYTDEATNQITGNPDKYTFGKVSSSGNGLGAFEYSEGTGRTIDYEILNVQDGIGRLSDGSVRNDTSDLITYPFNANKLLFDDLATQITNKKRQMDGPDSFEYSGSPAIRPADFQELNLLGDVYSGSGNWLDQSGKGNDGVVNGAIHNAAGYWEFDGVGDYITTGITAAELLGIEFTVEAWINPSSFANSVNEFLRVDKSSGVRNWGLYVNSSGQLRKLGTGGDQNSSYGTLSTNTWYHIVMNHGVSSNQGAFSLSFYSIYLNGTLVVGGDNDDYDNVNAFGNLVVGNSFAGEIGEVRIYPRALTAAQVFQNYNATKSKYINEAPDTAPKIGPNIVYDSNLLLNYDFGNRATYDRTNQNLVPYSQGDDWISNWTNVSATILSTTERSPVGTNDAVKYTGTGFYLDVSMTSGNTYVWSLYVKVVDAAGDTIKVGHGASQYGSAGNFRANIRYNLSDFSAEYDTSLNNAYIYDAVSVGDGWYRIGGKAYKGDTNQGQFEIYIGNMNATVIVWGPQLEEWSGIGDFESNPPKASRYFGTTGTTVNNVPTTVKNLSSSSYTGNIVGATFNPAGYLDFDGTNQYVNFGSVSDANFGTGDFAVECWFYDNGSPDYAALVVNGQSGGSDLTAFQLGRGGNAGGEGHTNRIEFTRGTSSGSFTIYDSTNTIQLNTWTYVAATRIGTTVKLYTNGVEVDSMTDSGSYSNTALRVGINRGGNIYWSGRISNVRIYKGKGLTAAEVQQNYNATKGRYA